MSKDPQLGLFSSHNETGVAPPCDLAVDGSTLPEAVAANVAATPEAMPTAKRRVSESIAHPRKDGAVPVAKSLAEERYLSVQDVARRYSISVQTVWRHTKHNPDFPNPIKILNGSTSWRTSEILAFEISRQEITPSVHLARSAAISRAIGRRDCISSIRAMTSSSFMKSHAKP
jgi:predicted DNA-binding transcriptional regulator AlpA